MPCLIQHCGVLILAAGESKRLGSPKQLLQYEGQPIINRLIEIVRSAGAFPLTIVLGASADAIKATLKDSNVHLVFNADWQEGMASSIRIGLTHMMEANHTMDGVLILVCDQPLINSAHIQALIQLQNNTGWPIAACFYAGVAGTPALFHQSKFEELLHLKGDIGAKKIIKDAIAEVAKLQFEDGVTDIDTVEDYQKIIQGEK